MAVDRFRSMLAKSFTIERITAPDEQGHATKKIKVDY